MFTIKLEETENQGKGSFHLTEISTTLHARILHVSSLCRNRPKKQIPEIEDHPVEMPIIAISTRLQSRDRQ